MKLEEEKTIKNPPPNKVQYQYIHHNSMIKNLTAPLLLSLLILLDLVNAQIPPTWKRPNEKRTISNRDEISYYLFGATYGDPQEFTISGFKNGTVTLPYKYLASPTTQINLKKEYGFTWIESDTGSFIIMSSDYTGFLMLDFDDQNEVSQKTEVDLASYEETKDLKC